MEYCKETRNRIRLSVAAFAYEMFDEPLITDSEFDELSNLIDPTVLTGNKQMDEFFQEKFSPDTGMWINSHPDLKGIERIYHLVKKTVEST